MPFGPEEIHKLAAQAKSVEDLSNELEELRREAQRLQYNMFAAVVAGGASPIKDLASVKAQIDAKEETFKQAKQILARKYLYAIISCARAASDDVKADEIRKMLTGSTLDSDLLLGKSDPATYIHEAMVNEKGEAILLEVFASKNQNLSINPYAGELILATLAAFDIRGKRDGLMPALEATKVLFDSVETFLKDNPKLSASEKTLFKSIVTQIAKLGKTLKFDEYVKLQDNTRQLIEQQKEPIRSATQNIFELAEKQRAKIVSSVRLI